MRTFELFYSHDGIETNRYTQTDDELRGSMYWSIAQFMTDGDTLTYKTGNEQVIIRASVNGK